MKHVVFKSTSEPESPYRVRSFEDNVEWKSHEQQVFKTEGCESTAIVPRPHITVSVRNGKQALLMGELVGVYDDLEEAKAHVADLIVVQEIMES